MLRKSKDVNRKRLRDSRGNWALVGMAGVVAGLSMNVAAIGVSGASASPNSKGQVSSHSSTVDYKYFYGKTITIEAAGNPGSVNDVAVRALVSYMETKLHATVNVVNTTSSQNGTLVEDQVAASPPNGLTLSILTVSNVVAAQSQKTPTIDFALKGVEWLGGFDSPELLIVGNPTSGPQTIQALLKTTTPIKVLTYPGWPSLASAMLEAAYSNPNIQILTGYTNPPTEIAGFERGDGPVTLTALSVLDPLITGGIAKPLLLMDKVHPGEEGYSYMKSTPTLAQLIAKDPPKTKTGQKILAAFQLYNQLGDFWFVSQGTPQKVVTALSDTIEQAMRQPSVKATYVENSLQTTFITPSESYAKIRKGIGLEPEFEKYLG